jgi:catechol 2,3-dioxygenase-like lactoylglutathione lyase family enzyme
MFSPRAAFCGVSVKDLATAKKFYSETLGLKLASEEMGLAFELPGGGRLFIYPKENHQPATYTMLNFVVDDIDAAVAELKKRGVKFAIYEGFHQDENGIARGLAAKQGPDIAWFTDPDGNIISVLQDK